jgi:hypothetical protein
VSQICTLVLGAGVWLMMCCCVLCACGHAVQCPCGIPLFLHIFGAWVLSMHVEFDDRRWSLLANIYIYIYIYIYILYYFLCYARHGFMALALVLGLWC